MSTVKSDTTDFRKFLSLKRKAVVLSQHELVKLDYLAEGETLPLLIQPSIDNVNLTTWATNNRNFIEAELFKHGAILFRGFNVGSISKFEQVAKAISPELAQYSERSSPRSSISGAVYTSTDHPAGQHILLHNEQSYTLNWPMKLYFHCVQPAEQGGRTPIANSRKIFERLNSNIIERFEQKRIMYVRNYGDGLGLPWQEVFQTNDKSAVEAHCRNASIEVEWKDNNGLRTRQVRPAIKRHPRTGETIWFNHAVFFHVSSLETSARESMLAVVKEEDLPYNTFYGDGSPFEPSVLDEIREVYRIETRSFDWQTGDVLLIDNMLTSHGREPFEGPRKIVVAMAEPYADYINREGK
jgi:alpha-ketoglutarate-dependent taurine dioxygenase